MPIGPLRFTVAARRGEIHAGGLARAFSPLPRPAPRSGIARRPDRRALLGALLWVVLATGWSRGAQAQPVQPEQPASRGGLLDGLSFTGPVGAVGKERPYNTDSIVFDDGYFVSTDCIQYGFTRSPYAAKRVGDAIHFQAVTRSPTHGTMTWEGVVRGNSARAEYRWVRERWFWTQRGDYWFKGERDVPARQ